jgi:parallel beta-helix repeat protein
MSKQILLFALAVALMPVCSPAAQYFVAPAGNDSAAGTSSAPWQTLQHAANIVVPGDRVTARAGNYVGFDLQTSGTVAAPIEFDADPGVLINQPNNRTNDGINLEDASHIVIDGFSVNGMPRAGVRSVGGGGSDLASFVTIRNVHATNNGTWGIFTGFVSDLLIEDNLTSGSIEQHGIYVSNSGDRPVIRDNVIFDNHGSGIHMNGDLSQGGDGIISGAVVSGNLIFNNAMPNSTYPVLGGGSGINMDGVQNSRIENNLVYNNHASGISLYKIDGAAGSSGNVVVNNTVYEPVNGRWALNIQTGSTNNTALNNILISDHASRGAIDISADSLSGFTSDFNAVISRFTTNGGNSVMSLSQWQTSTGQDAHSLIATAATLFANPGSNDYHLLSTSPAKNAGTSQLAPPADFDGLPRPAGSAYDIGAYEFGALAGDYNRDGAVNAADFITWRKSLGAHVTRFAGADGDGSGVIDQNDFLHWRTNFGASAAAGTAIGLAIPEPEAISSICLALILLRVSSRFQLR